MNLPSCHVQIRSSVLQATARPEMYVLNLAVLGYGCSELLCLIGMQIVASCYSKRFTIE